MNAELSRRVAAVVEKLAPPPEILARLTLRNATNGDGESVLALVASILTEYGLQIDPEATDADLKQIEASYLANGGAFLILEDADEVLVGSVGLYPEDDATCQLRKMYLVPALRGVGLGKYLLQYTVVLARTLGFKRMTLETSSKLKAANHLYTSFGFRTIELEHPSARADLAYEIAL